VSQWCGLQFALGVPTRTREHALGCGFVDVLCILFVRFARTKHPLVIAPLIPLSFVVGYQADLAWGNKMERVIGKNKQG
jgi:hypothetical protein